MCGLGINRGSCNVIQVRSYHQSALSRALQADASLREVINIASANNPLNASNLQRVSLQGDHDRGKILTLFLQPAEDGSGSRLPRTISGCKHFFTICALT
jgi:hypothetical protein